MPQIGEVKREKELGYKGHSECIWTACPDCGKERWVQSLKGKPKYKICNSCTRRGERHPCWKGGRKQDAKGYILVWVSPDDFFYPMANKQGRIFEHRLVVAKALKRCLLPWELVHHKWGYAKDDNRYPETLELITDKRFHFVDNQVKLYIKRLQRKIIALEVANSGLRQLAIRRGVL